MKICSKQPDLTIKSAYPKFKYRFPEADKPVEVEDEHAEKILKNPTFYEAKKTKALNKKETSKSDDNPTQ